MAPLKVLDHKINVHFVALIAGGKANELFEITFFHLALHKNTVEPYSLMKKIENDPSTASTPEVECITDADEELYQATVLIQAIIRGRASQMNVGSC